MNPDTSKLLSSLCLDVETPVKVPLVDIDNKPIEGGFLSVISLESKVYRQALLTYDREHAGSKAIDAEARTAVLISSMLVDWRLATPDGRLVELEFTKDVAAKLFGIPGSDWICNQIVEAAAKRKNFMPKLPQT